MALLQSLPDPMDLSYQDGDGADNPGDGRPLGPVGIHVLFLIMARKAGSKQDREA